MSGSAQEPQCIERVGESALKITWADGHQSIYSWSQLRSACPCAACRHAGRGGLPMAVHPLSIQPVGRYAIQLRFSDGHTTGIYAFDYLRSICACEACKPRQMDEG